MIVARSPTCRGTGDGRSDHSSERSVFAGRHALRDGGRRPPFLGETRSPSSVSTSTPRRFHCVAPRRSAACLEALILQLLEKDPQKRPQSAVAVVHVLESIESGKRGRNGIAQNGGESYLPRVSSGKNRSCASSSRIRRGVSGRGS